MTHEPHFCTLDDGPAIRDADYFDRLINRGIKRLGITGAPPRPIAGLPRPKPQPPAQRDITPEMVRQMVVMRKRGMPQYEIARHLKCSQSAVCCHLRLAGYGSRRVKLVNGLEPELNVRRT